MVDIIKIITVSLLGIYMLMGLLYFIFQERMIFVRYDIKGKYIVKLKKDHHEILLKAPDGNSLHALWIKRKNPKGLILYFHGNTGSLKRWGKIAAKLTDFGYDVLAPDYRGYGKSTGNPSEKALIVDAKLFYQKALDHYAPEQIIFYGRSLGSGVAVQLATQTDPKLVILETPFYSLLDVVHSKLPIYPYRLMLRHPFLSNRYIRQIKCPITMMHGSRDLLVYYRSAAKLYRLVADRPDVFFHTFEGGGHNDLSTFPKYQKILNDLL